MSHQDHSHFRTNLQSLKALLDQVIPPEVAAMDRHGNATLEPSWLAAVAIVCWGWTDRRSLNERVEMACAVVGELFHVSTTVTRQGLMKALASQGSELVDLMIVHLPTQLSRLAGHWTSQGKVNIAVDGTKFAAPRTEPNQAEFAASTNLRTAKPYRKKADQSKAATVQLLATVFWHLGTGLPVAWRVAGQKSSERKTVPEMLDQLPAKARLIGDAEYVGYPLWSSIIESNKSFLFRVGRNVKLLKNLGKFRLRDGYVSYWPESVMCRNQRPIVLRLFRLQDGKSQIYLVTNELEMSPQTASELYRQRWGVEVFFRSVKQTCQRRKLCCYTPQNIVTELNWTLLGVWAALFAGKQALHTQRVALTKLSPVKVIRAFASTVAAIWYRVGPLNRLSDLLPQAIVADESHRTTSKKSRNYPCKKKRKPCGRPIIQSATAIQRTNAKTYFT